MATQMVADTSSGFRIEVVAVDAKEESNAALGFGEIGSVEFD
jgi:hypothetical protein